MDVEHRGAPASSGDEGLNGTGRDGTGRGRVLVVDDDPSIRMLCSLNLRIEGFAVLEAANGEQGLEHARAERPDLIVTDVAMPGLDGFELADALRRDAQTRHIPLIFLSGETGAAHVARAHELGAFAFLRKPSDLPSLAAVSSAVVARHQVADAGGPAGDANPASPEAPRAGSERRVRLDRSG